MTGTVLTDALSRLETSLAALEAAVARRADFDARRGDVDTELAVMQDDRARLAVELDSALAQLGRLKAATDDVDRRVERALSLLDGIAADTR